MALLAWMGVGFCLSQSAMFSGLNLVFCSISKLRLELEAGRSSLEELEDKFKDLKTGKG